MTRDFGNLDAVFHALANDSRRKMLGRLALGELTVGQLADPLPLSLAAASKHLQVLERAGLVHRTVDGRRHVCRLDPEPLTSACQWIDAHSRHGNERPEASEDLPQVDRASRAAGPPLLAGRVSGAMDHT